MKDFNFYKENITLENAKDYKRLIDSIRYICDFNGYDKNFDFIEDIKNPALPKNGKIENNHIIGFKFEESKIPCAYCEYYERFNSEYTVFLGSFYVDKSFQGSGYGKNIYEYLQSEWKNQGYKKIILNVDLKNTNAILFWIKMEFKNINFSFKCNETKHESFYMLRLSKEI